MLSISSVTKAFVFNAFKAFAAGVALAGCDVDTTSENRVDVVVDGKKFGVVPNSDHWAAWWISEKAIQRIPPLSTLKPLQVQAIERVSGCKVVEAEFVPGAMKPAYLQAAVRC